MKPPSSTAGTVAASLGVLAAGAAIGAGAVALATRGKGDPLGGAILTVEGGVFGVLAGGFAGVVLAAASPRWKAVGDSAAIIGIGSPLILGAIGLTKAALSQSETPSLPPVAQTYSVDATNSGQTLNLNVGDTLNISLGAAYAAPTVDQTGVLSAGASSSTTDASGNIVTIYPFTATAAGTANVTAAQTGTSTTPFALQVVAT